MAKGENKLPTPGAGQIAIPTWKDLHWRLAHLPAPTYGECGSTFR